ncbi:MAG TPA: KpsF/GutQ family sugar-phosphate isomerase [Acidobacteriaceae bacterium]|jgi:arabinose-5-phosphate isomerase|nr:KpsF/GutQ family sugar-phosphate isomerase [Acidobacteriaceae bacterium]
MAKTVSNPADFVRIEAAALTALAARLESSMREPFERAVNLLAACASQHKRVIVMGMGKSGIIGQKIAATLSSTGTPSTFLHPGDAMHGDLGVLSKGDVVLALSMSGETDEISKLLPMVKRLGDALISFCGKPDSTLAQASDIFLDCCVDEEACALNLAPTASTTVMLALGDALAMEVSRRRGFKAEDFADLHPGGKLGKKLQRVSQLMHAGDALPAVAPATKMLDVIHEMSSKRLGMTTVLDGGKLVGIISDGDLRRLLEREGANTLEKTAGEVMNRTPRTIAGDVLATSALAVMEEKKITALVVVDAAQKAEGVIHLHDLWGTELI